jgi:hypothetical protein
MNNLMDNPAYLKRLETAVDSAPNDTSSNLGSFILGGLLLLGAGYILYKVIEEEMAEKCE